MDEPLLTGESLPVAKSAPDGLVFAGTTAVAGRGTVDVTTTGARSELGRIGKALHDIEEPDSPMQREIRRAVLWFGTIGFAQCAALVGIDAPALRAAHVGVALGGRGTDVAREAADLVLTDDRFETLVRGVREGRPVFVNLQHAVTYSAAIHVPTAGVTLLAALAGLPPLLMPIHIACLELLIDPACTLVFEAERPLADLMRRPPLSARLFDPRLVWTGLLQGVIVLAAAPGIVAVAMWGGASEAELRSLTFAGIVLSNAALLLANRSRWDSLRTTLARPNPALWSIAAAGALFAWLVTTWAQPTRIFHTAAIAPQAWLALAAGAVLCTLLLPSVHHLLRRR